MFRSSLFSKHVLFHLLSCTSNEDKNYLWFNQIEVINRESIYKYELPLLIQFPLFGDFSDRLQFRFNIKSV